MSKHNGTMSDERFEQLAESFGSDLARWPEEERAAAELLVSNSSRARATLQLEVGLDAVLSATEFEGPSAELRAQIASIPARHPRSGWELWPFRKLWQPAAVFAAAALLGVVVGGVATEPASVDDQASAADLVEFSELAFAESFDEGSLP